MDQRKLFLVAGTRPEVFKLGPIIRELIREKIPFAFCVVTQHGKLLESALTEEQLSPDLELSVNRIDPTLEVFLTQVLYRLKLFYLASKPIAVVVQGDTITAFAAAQVAFFQRIPVIHIEAGVRSGTVEEPFPEEAFRRWIDEIAALKFCPTPHAFRNLEAEGLATNAFVTGNTGIDSAARTLGVDASTYRLLPAPTRERRVLVDLHRRESWPKIPAIVTAIHTLAKEFPEVEFRVVSHPAVALPELPPQTNFKLSEPLSHLQMLKLIQTALFCITDSGGVQEEAAFLGTPALVARNRTDRPESLIAGKALLVGTDPARIAQRARELLLNERIRDSLAGSSTIFGDGTAAKRVVKILKEWLGG